MYGRGLLLALTVALAALPGCHSMGIPPFYEQSIDEGVPMREGSREVTWDEDVGLRPLFDIRHSEKQDRTEVHWFFPFGYSERQGNDRRIRFYPFYLHDVRTDPDGFEHNTTVAFPPGLFAGTHPVRGHFAYLFPLGGVTYGLFGKDEFVGVLFPLYGRVRDRGVTSHHFLFPFVNVTYGGDEKGTNEGFRILPFYSHNKRTTDEGLVVWDRTHVLWPFFSYVEEAKKSRNPTVSFFIFPFYGRTRSDWKDDETILWPLFRYFHDKQSHYEEWRVPFPFITYGRDDGTEGATPHTRLDVWPLFGVRERGDSYFREFFLFPIHRYERQETEHYTDWRVWFVPFIYTRYREGKDPAKPWSERKTRVWPLARYEREADGSYEIHALNPLWFDDPMLNFETILDPLYRLFRYAWHPDGREDLQLLLGLFQSRTKADGSSRWDVLGGLVGHGRDKEGKGSVRLLWFLDL